MESQPSQRSLTSLCKYAVFISLSGSPNLCNIFDKETLFMNRWWSIEDKNLVIVIQSYTIYMCHSLYHNDYDQAIELDCATTFENNNDNQTVSRIFVNLSCGDWSYISN